LIEDFITELSFYRAVVEALQPNKTLKFLYLFCSSSEPQQMSHDEVKLLASAVKKNYGLERLRYTPDWDGHMGDLQDLEAILRLNRVGRRYLAGDGHSIVRGVDVLSAVSDDLNCVFLHLLENPSLCNRDACSTSRGEQ
jgi:hypothetical protein